MTRPATSRPPSPRRTRTPAIALGVVLALILVLVGVLLAREVGRGPDDQAATGRSDHGATGRSDQDGTDRADADRQPSPELLPGRGAMEGIARWDEGDPLALGPVDAPVVMTIHSDFRCPFCGTFSREIEPVLVEEYVDAGDLRLEWRDLPIFGEQSFAAARAGRAAADQDRFWEFSRALYAAAPDRGHPDHSTEDLVGFAREAGVPDLDRFRADMAGGKYDAAIERDLRESEDLGAAATPMFFVNGTGILGARSAETFRTVIDRELAG